MVSPLFTIIIEMKGTPAQKMVVVSNPFKPALLKLAHVTPLVISKLPTNDQEFRIKKTSFSQTHRTHHSPTPNAWFPTPSWNIPLFPSIFPPENSQTSCPTPHADLCGHFKFDDLLPIALCQHCRCRGLGQTGVGYCRILWDTVDIRKKLQLI